MTYLTLTDNDKKQTMHVTHMYHILLQYLDAAMLLIAKSPNMRYMRYNADKAFSEHLPETCDISSTH